MPFVRQNEAGDIVSLHRVSETTDGIEGLVEIAADDPRLQDFLNEQSAEGRFEQLDLDFIRVIEDVIYLLIDKRQIVLTDLPVAAQRKLAERRNMRGRKGDLGEIVSSQDDFYLP